MSKQRLLGRGGSTYGGDVEGGHYKTEPDEEEEEEGRVKRLMRQWTVALARMMEFAKGDPRKVIFSFKMGLALTLVSLLVFIEEPFNDISTYSVWAILTVVVVFEYTIGATFSKGLNRGLGTITAAALALGAAELSTRTGEWEPVMILISIFIAGSGATFAKLYPRMKPYEYGFRVFLITFCFIMVSGYRTREFIHTGVNRFILIAIGAGVSLIVNIFIFPIWAGEDLHNLIVKNFTSVANSLEGCIDGYLVGLELERRASKIITLQAADDPVYNGYRSAVVSAAQEETLEGFASWEPPHGRYKMFKYPWKQFVKVGGALRHCAYMVMALHGCLLSEIQSPFELRQVFKNELQKVSFAGARVLRELGENIKTMTKLKSKDILFEVHNAAEELQRKIDARSYLLVNSESWVIGNRPEISTEGSEESIEAEERDHVGNLASKRSSTEYSLDTEQYNLLSRSWDVKGTHIAALPPKPPVVEKKYCKRNSWPSKSFKGFEPSQIDRDEKTLESARALSLVTFASLLIEFVARLDNLVKAFNELSEQAHFKEPETCPQQEQSSKFRRLLKLLRLRS